ncbi:MAG: MmgE/PrpD family protein [Erythrobacter sp.]
MNTVPKPSDLVARTSGETTDSLVDCIMSASFSDLDPKTIQYAKTFLADSLITGVGGVANPASLKVLTAAKRWDAGGTGNCRVLGRPNLSLSPHSAAVVNGFQIHCLEWDALHEPSVVIALCTPVAAILSEAQESKAKLNDCLFALTMAVEIAVMFGAAAKGHPRFFRPSAAGVLGAAVAIGLLRGFDRDAMTRLLGLAYSQVSGTMQAHWEGSEALPMQIGIAARAALTAADLAQVGLAAPKDIVDGKFGYFALIEDGGDFDASLQQFAKPWKITEVAHKPFPAGRATQATLTAIMDLQKEADFTIDDVVSLTAYVPSLILLLVGRPYQPDMEGAYARLCLQCIAPMMIRHGEIDPGRFKKRYFDTLQAIEDAKKIHVVLADNPDPNALAPQQIVIELEDGRVLEAHIDAPFGSPSRPLTRADEIEKARLSFASARFASEPAAVFNALDTSGGETLLTDILRLVTQPEDAQPCL